MRVCTRGNAKLVFTIGQNEGCTKDKNKLVYDIGETRVEIEGKYQR